MVRSRSLVLVCAPASLIPESFQVTRPAIERNEEDRVAYKMLVGEHFEAHHLVFADETHLNRVTLRRRYGWAPIGDRARRRDFFIRGKRYVPRTSHG